MSGVFRCRKCGKHVFDQVNLIEEQRETDLSVEYSEYTQWFLDPDECPEWVKQSVFKEKYTRGKLGCPKCFGRIGAFDFIRKREFKELGPIWLQKSRIDLVRHVNIPAPRVSLRRFPIHHPSTENISHPPLASVSSVRRLTCVGALEAENRENMVPSSALSTHENVPPDFSPPPSNISSATGEGVTKANATSLEAKSESKANASRVQPPMEKMADFMEEESAFTCPICLDVLYDAHTCNPCLHVYCAPCLRRLCGAAPIHTKCPLCRQVISSCLPNYEMTSIVKDVFPGEYKLRSALEKKTRKKLPPLPNDSSFPHVRFSRDRNRNYVLVHWAGVCFVVLLCVFIISILVTTIGMVLWYLWETSMDYLIDLLVSVNSYFDYSWQLIITILMEKSDEISPELAKILLGSYGQVLTAVGKLFNKTLENAKDFSHLGEEARKKINAQYAYTVSAFQVDLANYILIMGFVTFLIYRFARYRQARQVVPT